MLGRSTGSESCLRICGVGMSKRTEPAHGGGTRLVAQLVETLQCWGRSGRRAILGTAMGRLRERPGQLGDERRHRSRQDRGLRMSSEAHRVQPTVEYLGGRCRQILCVLGRFAPEDRDILARVNDVGGVGNEPLLNLTGVNF